MPAEILSLDLDWFNLLEYDDDGKLERDCDSTERQKYVRHFFAELKNKCTLPKIIDLVPEHQYLYPWSLKILGGIGCRKINVVNIDEHHDFYCLDDIKDFDDEYAVVGCWNFFAFMAHKHLLGKYLWVTNKADKREIGRQKKELLRDLRNAESLIVRQYKKRVEVVGTKQIFDAVQGRRFDGFLIIRSPEYTLRHRSLYHAVDLALKSELSSTKVRRYKCRTNFSNGKVHHRANSLFCKL